MYMQSIRHAGSAGPLILTKQDSICHARRALRQTTRHVERRSRGGDARGTRRIKTEQRWRHLDQPVN
jgi:hypothetical protein